MPDIFDTEKRSKIMSKIRSKNTKPELVLRSALHKKGLRYRLHAKELPGRPVIVFRPQKIAVQVRGCFWHLHDCIDGHIPLTRQDYWREKLHKNKRRDATNDRLLKENGWEVICVWECELSSQKKIDMRSKQIFDRVGA